MLEDAIEDGGGEIGIVKNVAPRGERLVGGEDHGLALEVAGVDDVVEHVGGVLSEGEVADLVDHEDGGLDEVVKSLLEASGLAGAGEVVDQLGGVDEECVEAVLDGAIGDRDGEVRLSAAWLAVEDHVAPVGDEVRGEERAEHLQAQRGLEGEVEVVDGLEEWQSCGACTARDACLYAVGDLFRDGDGEHVAVAPLLALGAVE